MVVREQVDIAVDLGVVPPPLPEILSLRQLVETTPEMALMRRETQRSLAELVEGGYIRTTLDQ